ncbi:MAG: hypothetical protein PHI10_05025 [Dehalococcoidales bacterium]|nr:hypothetical protein [Dehalococcoidales bacterium]
MIEPAAQNEISEQLMKHIIDKREEIKLHPIKTEATSLAEAQELAVPDLTGHTLSTIISLSERYAKSGTEWKNTEKYLMYITGVVVLLIIPLIYYMTITKGV